MRHQPKQSLGQNFLLDPNLQRKIVEAIEPAPDDRVLEIGPGQGALTQHLAPSVGRLILVELDDDLAARLATEYADNPRVTIIHADFLRLDLDALDLDLKRLKVIGNIPYNITTPILFHLLERRPRPRCIVLMVQREVADRILAAPGSKAFGALAVGVQAVADATRLFNVSRHAFRPAPGVESTVLRIVPHAPPRLEPGLERRLRSLTRVAFGRRRKQFQRILRDALHIDLAATERLEARTGLDLTARPESFSADEFVRLTRALEAEGAFSVIAAESELLDDTAPR